ncbi:tricarballylate utilization protein B [Desulfosarcina widdelii]|uniref:Tricarballylate utilization protein B n=1 Tax=Desulfosarcina widdelii TaxID=947919 RepID=A0A5K7YTJ3_9BACT|nr:tricarballylate utilization 4Fe-4S protein TcuB [Desulfosarcina widdelii]BBO72666.1 tricarballylate utilization protein B [Desulfosarcina widdelii]
MSSTILKEAERVMTICNACRYCEGFCAVYPAMGLRRTFSEGDLKYLANLCHNCRACYYACQYAPNHPFAVNVPKTMAELRQETYLSSTWPRAVKGFFRNNGLLVSFVTVLSVCAVLLLTLLFQSQEVFFGIHTGENAFYKVIPYTAMVLPFMALAVFTLVSLWKGFCNQWREIGGTPEELADWRAHILAVCDVLRLKYLDGGGEGCNYPDYKFRMIRRYFHHAVFYGFLLCLISTTVAFFYDHFLNRPAPYPFWSWPVLLGTIGGIALLVGTGGLMYLKLRMDRMPAASKNLGMDVAFIVLLFLTALSGTLLLCLRATTLMGSLLSIHLGFVIAFFVTMPYGKFLHGIFRYGALVRYAIEQRQSGKRDG